MPLRIQIAVLLLSLSGCSRSRAPERESKHPEIVELLGQRMTHYVRPVYPAWARREHIEGIVRFSGIIGKDGRIRDLSFVSGPILLVPYAESAVHQWRYEPTILNGVAVETKTQLDVQFTLRQ